MTVQLPTTFKPLNTVVTVVRPQGEVSSPRSNETTVISSPYAKLRFTVDFPESRAPAVTDWFGALADGQNTVVEYAVRMSNRARGTAALQCTGSGTLLTVTEVGTGAASRPLVNNGAGFKRGQLISVLQDGQRYCYVVASDQSHDTQVRVTSRLRGGAITPAAPVTYDPPIISGRVVGAPELTWLTTNLYGVRMVIEELR